MKLLVLKIFFVILLHLLKIESVTAKESMISYSNNSFEKPMDIEHIAVRKWKKFDAILQNISSSSVKKLFPFLVRANEDLNLSSGCSRSIMKFLAGIKKMKTWAFKMLDSSGKLPNGIFSGSINSLGDYDECINLNITGHFQGQYCTLYVQPPMPERRPFISTDSEIPEFINITDSDTVTGELLRRAMYYYHLKFRTSVCVPSTCTKEEVEKIAQKVMKIIDIEFNITVPNCEVKEEHTVLSRSQIVVIAMLSSLFLLGITATLVEITNILGQERQKTGFLIKCLYCFSFYSNTVRLLKKDNSSDSIKIFHGMKVITILWVILNHTYYYLNFQACRSLLEAREKGKEILFQLVINGFLNVETFFFISSVLVAYGVIKMKDASLNVRLYIFRRFWRLTPPFLLVIASVQLLPLLGSGPVWKETVVKGLTEKCQHYWWTNLLYINNFIPNAEACLPWHWYIPVDTHLYMLSLIVLIPLKKNPLLAFVLNGVILVCGLILTAVLNVYYRLPPTAIYVYNHPEDISYYVDNGYFRTYLHCSTYCVGLTVGYIIASRKELHLSKKMNLCGWITSFVSALTVLYGVYDWNQGNAPSLFVSTLYTCTNKLVWSLALAWVTIACMTGNGDVVKRLLSCQIFVPLGRLTYMTYLIHPLIQYVYIGSLRTLMRTDHRTLIYMYLANVVIAFMWAYALSLLFESPFMALEKLLFSRMKNAQSAEVNGKANIVSKKNIKSHQNDAFSRELTEPEQRIRT